MDRIFVFKLILEHAGDPTVCQVLFILSHLHYFASEVWVEHWEPPIASLSSAALAVFFIEEPLVVHIDIGAVPAYFALHVLEEIARRLPPQPVLSDTCEVA